jgi:hypothetical protein
VHQQLLHAAGAVEVAERDLGRRRREAPGPRAACRPRRADVKEQP